MGNCTPIGNRRQNTVLNKEVRQIFYYVRIAVQLFSEQDKCVIMGEVF